MERPTPNPEPTLRSTYPAFLIVGDSVTVFLRGTGFFEGARAYRDGAHRPVTFVNDSTRRISCSSPVGSRA